MSIGLFFSIVTAGLASALPTAFYAGLTGNGVPAPVAAQIAHLPPTAALFGAFLGYNPVAQLLLPATLQHLNPQNQAVLLGKTFFPNLISGPFMVGLHAVFYVSAGLCIIAAIASYLRGRYTTYKADTLASGAIASDGSLTGAGGSTTVLEPAYA